MSSRTVLEGFAWFLVSVAILGVGVWGADAMIRHDQTRCVKRWENTGIASQWRKEFGCYVQLKDGVWVPASLVRFAQ